MIWRIENNSLYYMIYQGTQTDSAESQQHIQPSESEIAGQIRIQAT